MRYRKLKKRVSGKKKQISSGSASPSTTTSEKPKVLGPHLIDDDINIEICCVCFGQYSDDIGTKKEWLECTCSQWVHEDCAENIVYDINGREAVSIMSLCRLIL